MHLTDQRGNRPRPTNVGSRRVMGKPRMRRSALVLLLVSTLGATACTSPSGTIPPRGVAPGLPERCPAKMPQPSKSNALPGSGRTMVPGEPTTVLICRYPTRSIAQPSEAFQGPTAASRLATMLNGLKTGPTCDALIGPFFALFFNYQTGHVQLVTVPTTCGYVSNGRRFAPPRGSLASSLDRLVNVAASFSTPASAAG
jgi:hypothetical protein